MVLKWPARWFVFIIFLVLLQSTGLLLTITFYHHLQPFHVDNTPKHVLLPHLASNPAHSLREKKQTFSDEPETYFASKPFRLLKGLLSHVHNESFRHDPLKNDLESIEQETEDSILGNSLPATSPLQNCSMLVDGLKEKGFVERSFDFFSHLLQYLWARQPSNLPLCPLRPPNLTGHLTWRRFLVQADGVGVDEGGVWKPQGCRGREKVVVVVPYRYREEHLEAFLPYIHLFMQRQLLDYRVLVVEQQGQAEFNRGALMNIGFKVAQRIQKVDCAIFHDVDLLPEHDFNFYRCGHMPRHMSVSVSSFGYKLPYRNLFGGIEAFSSEHFKRVNGFSNLYFGWGGEDDDLYKRVYLNGLQIIRYSEEIATYIMLDHPKQAINPKRFELLRGSSGRQDREGLSSAPLHCCLNVAVEPLFTHVTVNLDRFYRENLKTSDRNTATALFRRFFYQ